MVSQSLVTSEERDLHEQEAGRAMIGGGGGGGGGPRKGVLCGRGVTVFNGRPAVLMWEWLWSLD